MLPLSQNQIKAIYQEALTLKSQGKLEDAEKRFRTILANTQSIAEVHFQLGQIAALQRRFSEAETCFETALKLKPQEPGIWSQLTEVIRLSTRPADKKAFQSRLKTSGLPKPAIRSLQERLMSSATSTTVNIGSADPAHVQKAINCLQTGDAKGAEAAARKLVKSHPKLAVAHFILGSAQAALGKLRDARQSLETTLRLKPDYSEARDTYGRVLFNAKAYDRAIEQFQTVLKEKPGHFKAMGNLGLALCEKGEVAGGLVALRNALELNPKQPEIRQALGRHLSASSRTAQEAIDVLEEAVKQGDKSAVVYINLAKAHGRLGQDEQAQANFAIAEEINPDSIALIAARALYFQTLGDFEAAEQDFRRAIAMEPDNGEIYRSFGATYKFQEDDPLLAEMVRRFEDKKTSDKDRMHFGFALARAMEGMKAHDRVFTYLRPANDLMAARHPFDIAARAETVRGTIAAFKDADLDRKIAGTTDYAPIFVTGMPRSGTTLVEQILSSHSTVTGTGEVGYAVPLISKQMLTSDGKSYAFYGDLPDDVVAGFGHDIEAELRKLAPDTPRATDKSIQTYMLMGAIKQAIPNAKIVLVRRDPRDLLFSIYKNFFREGTHTYAYDQKVLGQYYRLFEEMVAFWREKIPGGFHEIQYEDLVENHEQEARKLLAACDLKWEDQCLSFHENKRQVRTLSVAQVRQPIYASSLKGWQRHEDDLRDLIDALGDAV